jgi:hypothetical protein
MNTMGTESPAVHSCIFRADSGLDAFASRLSPLLVAFVLLLALLGGDLLGFLTR